jgi:type IV pilus assembly protein PilB
VILVGEMRDAETAGSAVGAALTGHLALSTLHTNDAPSTIIRLVELGIEPFVVSSSVVLVCAQRLLRRLCPRCKVPAAIPESCVDRVEQDATFFEPATEGCEQCEGTGYRGRIGIYELLIPNEKVRDLMATPKISSAELRKLAIQEGMTTLYDDAIQKAAAGICSAEDALTAVAE